MDDQGSIRTFLAIEIPLDILNEIGSIQSRLKRTLQGMVRWVRPEAIHLTLKFFGNVSENNIAEISRIMEEHVNGISPFAFDVQKLGVFPNMNRPRILWLGISGDVDALILFQKSMERKLRGGDLPKEESPFRPHLTLARIKEPKGLMGLAKIIEKSDNYRAGRFDAEGLHLYRSQLTPRGAVYTKLAYFPFSG